jgi:adenylyltransferase/sulfurtransferase
MNIDNIARYSRQLMIPEVGLNGQMKLLDAKVLVVGTGGLGCPVLLYLAAAGIGTIGIADFDTVDLSNLQRQILFSEKDIGKSKADSAALKILSINSDIQVKKISTSLSVANALDIVGDYDVVIDASDNFQTRYVLNDACFIQKVPLVYGSLFRLEGQVSVFNLNRHSPCYRCLYPTPPPRLMIPGCSEGGALGSVAGIIGSIQATECIKIILGKGSLLSEKMINVNLLDLDFSLLAVRKSPSCIICTRPDKYHNLDPTWYEFEELKNICTKVKNISNQELVVALKNNRSELTLINVKEVWENIQIAPKAKEISIPLSIIEKDLQSVIGQLSHQGKNVFYCIDGSRSEHAILLIEQEFGFANLYSFKGNPHSLIS